MDFDLSICTITMNHWNVLKYCINSIESETDVNLRIQLIIVDNCSSDFDYDSLVSLSNPYFHIEVIRNRRKLNFSANNNIAIRRAKSDIILILNPDTIICKGTIGFMVDFIKKTNDLGAVTCKLINPDGSLQDCCRRFPKLKYLIANRLKTWKLIHLKKIIADYIMSKEKDSIPKEVYHILGACMFVKKEVFNKVGLFDERFLFYGEDTDLCYRIKQAGWKIFYVPNVSIIHLYARAGAKRIYSKYAFLQVYTALLFYAKHYWKIIK